MSSDPLKYFRIEARELLDQLSRGILELEKGDVRDQVPRILRLAHTMKGAARVVKQLPIAEAAHAVEDILSPCRDASAAPTREQVDALLALLDTMEAHVSRLAGPAEPAPAAPAPEPPPGAPVPAAPPAPEPFRTRKADTLELDALLDGVAETHAQLALIRRGSRSLERSRHLAGLLAEQLGAAAREQPGMWKMRAMAEELNQLVTRVDQDITAGTDYVDRELMEVRESAERLRLLPASAIFRSLERMTRDVARALGKNVVFTGIGAEVRLDGQVLGTVQGALLQAVRNAVVHGIESVEERRAAGKEAVARITVRVARRGDRVSFACDDDGRGVDLEAVRRVARAQGMLTATASRDELIRLLLKGGLSTSATVTEHAGRGVGLDVVREAAEKLGGAVAIQTATGQGTSVEMLVPVSLASIRTLTVESGGTLASLPLDVVVRTLRIRAGDVLHTARGSSIRHDGREIPFLPLQSVLSRGPTPAWKDRAWTVVVLTWGPELAAIGVDRLRGTTSVILRPLPALAPADPVVVGASLDVEGTPRIVLDAQTLVAAAGRQEGPRPDPVRPRAPILIIDDSLTTRMLEQSILDSAGFTTDIATSGEEAMDKVQGTRYALFLVDVEMPGMDGFTFIQRVKADPGLRDIPAILVTSRNSPEDRRRGEEVGACAYVVKSEFDQVELLDRIRSLVGRP